MGVVYRAEDRRLGRQADVGKALDDLKQQAGVLAPGVVDRNLHTAACWDRSARNRAAATRRATVLVSSPRSGKTPTSIAIASRPRRKAAYNRRADDR
jgi:hypothetical protein